MTQKTLDRHARKQVLLTRIAFDRTQLRNDLHRAGQAARLPHLLRGVLGRGLMRSLFGAPSGAGAGGWVGTTLTLLRRYRVAAALVGAVVPIFRGQRSGWRRLVRVAGVGAVAWAGWRFGASKGQR